MADPRAWLEIPTTLLDISKRAAEADAWARAQRERVAELWANAQRQAIDRSVKTWQDGMASLDKAPTPVPQPVPLGYNDMAGADSSGLGAQNVQDGSTPPTDSLGASQQGPTPYNDMTGAQSGPVGGVAPGAYGKTMGGSGASPDAFAPIAKTLPGPDPYAPIAKTLPSPGTTVTRPPEAPGVGTNLLDSMREGASHAGMYLPPPPGSASDPQKETSLMIQAEQSRTRPTIGPGGLGLFNPNQVPGGANPSEEATALAGDVLGKIPGVGGVAKFAVGGGSGADEASIPPPIEPLVPHPGAPLPIGNAVSNAANAAGHLVGQVPTPNAVTSPTPAVLHWINEVIAPAKNTPEVVQQAFRDFAGRRLQALVDADTLARKAQQILGTDNTAAAASLFERTGQFVANPTAAQRAFSQQVGQFMTDTGAAGRAHGYINGDVTLGDGVQSYFPHVYQDVQNAAQQAARKAGLNAHDFYSNARVFPTIDEAIANGMKPLDSVALPLRQYAARVADSEAKAQLISDLKAAAPDSVLNYRPGDPLPPGWVPGDRLDRVFAPKPTSILDAQGQPQTVYGNGVAFAPDVAKALGGILNPSALRSSALGRAALDSLGAGKEVLFSLSGFHLLTELRQSVRANGVQGIPVLARSVWSAIAPGAYDTFRMSNADLFSEAARSGVTGLVKGAAADLGGNLSGVRGVAVRAVAGGGSGAAAGYLNAKASGLDDQTAIQHAAVDGAIGAIAGPTLGKAMSNALWERAVPTLKVLTYGIQKSAGADPEAAASFVNNVFGGQNLAAIARSKTVQDVARLVALAPDWWESWANQVGSAVRGGATGRMGRAYWMRTGALDGAFILEGLNLALNGHPTTANEPGHQLDLEVTGAYDRLGLDHTDPKTGRPYRVYADVLGPIKTLIQAPFDPGHFAQGRESIPLSAGLQALTNRDYRGQPIVQPGTPWPVGLAQQGANALQRIAPVGPSSLDQSTTRGDPLGVAAVSSVTGVRTSHGGPATVTPADTELQRLGITVGQAGKSLRGIDLTTQEHIEHERLASQRIQQVLTGLVQDPRYAKLTDAQKLRAVNLALSHARDQAAQSYLGQLIQQQGKDAIIQRIQDKRNAKLPKAG